MRYKQNIVYHVKVAIPFPFNLFPLKTISRNKYTCAHIITNASYVEICVDFERKNNTTLVFLLSNCLQLLKIFHD